MPQRLACPDARLQVAALNAGLNIRGKLFGELHLSTAASLDHSVVAAAVAV